MVGRPSRRSGNGRETLLEVRKWSGGPKLVGTPSRRFGSGRETLPEFRKWSRSGWGTLPKVRKRSKTLPKVRKRLGDPPGVPKVVGGHSRISGSGRDTVPEVRKWSGDCPEGLEVIGMFVGSQETLLEVRK